MADDENERYVVPRWPAGAFNLVAQEGGVELGPCTADSWEIAENGAITDWRSDGAHPIRLRVRMQAGDLLYANNGDVGEMTYRIVPVAGDGVTSDVSTPAFDLNEALTGLWDFLGRGPFTAAIAQLERDLEGAQAGAIPEILARYGATPGALESGLIARDRLGRINDVIHALAIALMLPSVLEEGEVLQRPSLAAGNDPTRPFDVETDRRIAEFKLSRWDGHDTSRMRQLVKDLVYLATDRSGRRVELYVLDDRPRHFLETSTSTVGWALGPLPRAKDLFLDRFGDLNIAIADFRSGAAAHVEVLDIRPRLGRLIQATDRRCDEARGGARRAYVAKALARRPAG
jgi:hypothetical protein